MHRTLAILPSLAVLLAGSACAGVQRPTQSVGDQLIQQAPQRDQGYDCTEGKEYWRGKGTPVRGGTWRWANQTVHLDPTAPDGRWWYQGGVYEFLVKPRTCYFNDMTVVPDLAKSWDVSTDGMTFTMHLRDGVKWQNLPPVNGRSFTAADVAWTIEFQKTGQALREFWQNIDHQEPNATTVVLKLKEPNADFLNLMADEHNTMMPREVKEQKGDFKTTMVGTGAFQLKDFKQNTQLVWERNPGYYQMGADGKPLPYLDQIVQTYFADRAASVAAYRAGLIDRNDNGGYFKIEADEIKKSGVKTRSYDNPAANQYSVWMKASQPPFNDVRVRRAVSLAIDRDDIIAGLGGGGVQQGFLPSAVGGEYAWSTDKIKSTFKPNVEQAKKLMAEAGLAGGVGPFTFKSAQGYAENVEVIAKQLEAIGLKTTIELGAGTAVTPVLSKKDFDMAYGPWSGGRLPSFWLGEIVMTGNLRNITGYSDPKLDQLAKEQIKELDNAKRKVLLDQIQDYMVETMPMVPTITRVYYHFEACRVQNARPQHNSASAWGMMEAWIDDNGAC